MGQIYPQNEAHMASFFVGYIMGWNLVRFEDSKGAEEGWWLSP